LLKTISRYYAYHGTTLATLAAGGRRPQGEVRTLPGEFVHVPAPTCYRCPMGLNPNLQRRLRQPDRVRHPRE
jgi:4-aminobutyrate aminotransferase-like enzyme